MSATAQVVEQKMEPIAKAVVKPQLVVTGQGLYDMFMETDQAQQTRMQWIREVLVPNADPLQVKGATDELVKLAIKKDVANGLDEKVRGPKRNTAMNVRTIVQQVYGSLKFAEDQMIGEGFDETTGWLEASKMAKVALTNAGKVWNGYDIPDQAAKEKAALQRKNAAETKAYLEATKDNPRELNESFADWNARVAKAAEGLVVTARHDNIAEQSSKLATNLIKKYDREVLATMMHLLQKHFQDAGALQSEISEAEADALLAAAVAEDAVEVTEGESVTA